MGLITKHFELAVQHQPAANTVATISVAADAAARIVCKSLTASVAGTAASGLVTVNLRDGAAGAGTILMSKVLICAANGTASWELSDLNIAGTKNTAMTLEFDAAGGASTEETVAFSYYKEGEV